MKRIEWAPTDEAEAVEMYRKGHSLAQIGEWLGRRPSSVRTMLLRHGVAMRAMGRHHKSILSAKAPA